MSLNKKFYTDNFVNTGIVIIIAIVTTFIMFSGIYFLSVKAIELLK